MTYYFVLVNFKDPESKMVYYRGANISEEKILAEIVGPFRDDCLLLSGVFIPKNNIRRILIFALEQLVKEKNLPSIENVYDSFKFINDNISYLKTIGAKDVTASLLKGSLVRKEETKKCGSKNRIFIVHGRDMAPALELKNHLKDTLHLDAVIFDDVKKGRTSPTIIQLLEEIMTNAAYAFITATPDDLGCYCKDITECKEFLIGKRSISGDKVAEILSKFKPRARQNVVFEFGLFMGALGRDKVCCLLHTDVKDKPTDVDGILYEPFKDSVKETFSQISEKLREPKVGLIKE